MLSVTELFLKQCSKTVTEYTQILVMTHVHHVVLPIPVNVWMCVSPAKYQEPVSCLL